MECLIGMAFDDFVMVAADQTNARSIMVMKSDQDKFCQLSDKLVMAVSGESGDTTQFAEYIQKNIQLYKMRNGYELSPSAAANFTRRNLADYLRSRTPYQVNLLIAGYDRFFTTALLDAHYKSDMTRQQAYNLMIECVKEVQKRLVLNLPNFAVIVVDKEGVTNMDTINPQVIANAA